MAIAQPGEYISPVYADFSKLQGETVLLRPELCNCYRYVQSQYPSLPPTATILNNIQQEGEVAVFYYQAARLHHYAVVREETDTHYIVEETNYKSCAHSVRMISKDDPSLLGFFPI